jgi:hypothetical protein
MIFPARRFVLLLVVGMWFVSANPMGCAEDSYQTATVLSARQIRHGTSLNPSRFSGPVSFTVDFAFRLSAESYCVGYETPVLDEVQDLLASNGKDIKVEMRGKKLSVVLPTGRRIKAELVKQTQC